MDIFVQTVRKYAPAISLNLYPSQTKELKRALTDYAQGCEPYIYDPFVRLAYEMVVADLKWQEDMK